MLVSSLRNAHIDVFNSSLLIVFPLYEFNFFDILGVKKSVKINQSIQIENDSFCYQ